MSAPGHVHSWKSEFQSRKMAFERPRRDELESSASESEGVLPSGRRSTEERYGRRRRESDERSGNQPGSRTLMSPPGIRDSPRGRTPQSVMVTQRHPIADSHTLAIGEETGQKERVIVQADTISPAFSSQSQSDDSEREDLAMAAQISTLSKQNQHLEALLREREQERDRLREMLERDTGDQAMAGGKTGAAYLPPGLPSKVLDGRKVMKPGERSPRTTDTNESTEHDLLADIDALRKSRLELEQRLHEVSEDKRRLEAELARQREALRKVQDREQDLSKDIETLRDENSHHSGTISKLQVEQRQLQTDKATLHGELSVVTEKLSKVQRCYRQAEQENMHLAEELREMERDRVKLYEEKMKLQLSVDDGYKTKENYRSTIKKLREENTTLKTQVSDTAKEKPPTVVAKPPVAVSKEKLVEMMEVRVERTQLKEQLQSAQRDIDLLKAQIEGHSLEQQATNTVKREVEGHLKDLRSQLSSVYDDLEATRTTVTTLTDQQSKLVKEKFETLASKCRRQLQKVEADKTELTRALEKMKKTVAKLQIELEVVRASNLKLQSQKSIVADNVSHLRAEVAQLRDQKKLLQRQLSQNESLQQEKDKTCRLLEAEQHKLKSQLQSSEKNWKNQFVRLEQGWQDRMAEMNLVQENLAEENEDLVREKERVEGMLAEVKVENKELEEGKRDMEAKVSELEAQIAEMNSKLVENVKAISQVRRGIAQVLVKQACSAARASLCDEHERNKLAAREGALQTQVSALAQERDALGSALKESQRKGVEMEAQTKEVQEKNAMIEELSVRLATLSAENETLRTEIQSLGEQRQSAVDNLQQLSEAKQSLQLESQKIQITLGTEIRVLQSKLKSVEDEKQALEDKVSGLVAAAASGRGGGGGGGGGGGSAFQGLPGANEGGYMEGLRRQVGTLQAETQQLRRENSDLKEKKAPSADLQSRLVMLEAENRRLKDTLRSGKEPPDSNPALRKKIIKLSQRNFFLEWEKKDLSDKLQIALRLSRETREKAANEQEKRLREMNHALHEKVRGLEDSLLKRRSAIDSRITETVKENGRLHQRLLVLKSDFDEGGAQRAMVEESAKWVGKEGPRVLNELKAGLMGFKQDLQELEACQKRMQTLQSELQQMVSAESSIWSTKPLSRPSSATLPPVLKSLNPSYLSRLAGSANSPPPSSPTPLPSSPRAKSPSIPQSPTSTFSSDTKEKFQLLNQATDDMAIAVKSSLELVSDKEVEITLVSEQLAEHEEKLMEAVGVNKKLQDQFDRIEEQDLLPDQLQTIAMLQKQIESLEDQVIDRDAALQEIESQMKQDYEQHDQLISKLKFQVLDLRDQLTSQAGKLRAKDQYLQQADSRYLELETQLISVRKELERLANEREQLVSQALPEHLKMVAVATGGPVSLGDVIRLQGDEIRALQKSLSEYGYQMTQMHQQLSTADRQRSTLQAKMLSLERMHQQMKEHLSADINHLRTLNLQFVEQQVKGDKGKVLLEEVRKVKEALRQQHDAAKIETELSTAKVKLLEQDCKTKDLEFQLHTLQVSLTMVQADKKHALSSLSQDMTNQITPHATSGYLPRRPMSAGSEGGGACRKPKYHFMNRGQPSSRTPLNQAEFTIQIPGTKGGSQGGSEIVNLEEHTEKHHNTLSLGPAVVTDDESSGFMQMHLKREHDESKMEKVAKHQQIKKIRRHRRTASTGSNVVYIPQKESPSATLPPPSSSSQSQHVNIVKPKPVLSGKHPNRPGSAGSNPMLELHRIQSPEQIRETAHEVADGIAKMIRDGRSEEDVSKREGEVRGATGMRRVRSGGVRLGEGVNDVGGGNRNEELTKQDNHAMKLAMTTSLPPGLGSKPRHKYSEIPRNKPSGKGAETTDVPSPAESAGTSRKIPGIPATGASTKTSTSGWLKPLEKILAVASSSQKDKSIVLSSPAASQGQNPSVAASGNGSPGGSTTRKLPPLSADLTRTPSILSTSSTISTFPPSTLPSRTPSFAYDGGGESSPYSYESVEIGDSIENLLALQSGKMNFSYFIPIRQTKPHDTTSSSDDDSVRGYRHSRRKRSSGTNTDTAHSTQQSKDEDDNSNSSNDSDQLQANGYHSARQSEATNLVCRHESISISAMEDCPTDHEVDEKAALLKKSFPRDRQGRLRTSSTGSLHVCYSDSNTSMEDVSKNF